VCVCVCARDHFSQMGAAAAEAPISQLEPPWEQFLVIRPYGI